jgi:hypothetical protein
MDEELARRGEIEVIARVLELHGEFAVVDALDERNVFEDRLGLQGEPAAAGCLEGEIEENEVTVEMRLTAAGVSVEKMGGDDVFGRGKRAEDVREIGVIRAGHRFHVEERGMDGASVSGENAAVASHESEERDGLRCCENAVECCAPVSALTAGRSELLAGGRMFPAGKGQHLRAGAGGIFDFECSGAGALPEGTTFDQLHDVGRGAFAVVVGEALPVLGNSKPEHGGN